MIRFNYLSVFERWVAVVIENFHYGAKISLLLMHFGHVTQHRLFKAYGN